MISIYGIRTYDIYPPHYNLSLSKLEMNVSHFSKTLSDCDNVSNIYFLSSTKHGKSTYFSVILTAVIKSHS